MNTRHPNGDERFAPERDDRDVCDEALQRAGAAEEALEKAEKRIAAMESLLEECHDYFDGLSDVMDGDDGIPTPNPEMDMRMRIREVLDV